MVLVASPKQCVIAGFRTRSVKPWQPYNDQSRTNGIRNCYRRIPNCYRRIPTIEWRINFVSGSYMLIYR